MAVFRVERNTGYTVMSNHHLRNKELSLKAKGLLSQMLSLPEDWDYTLSGLSYINRESIDAIRTAVWELEKAGYITRRQGRDEKGKMTAIEYTIYEQPQPPELDCPVLENPTADNPILENPTTDNPTSENPTQLNKDISRTNLPKKEKSNTDLSITHSIPIHSLNPLPYGEDEAAQPPERKRTERNDAYRVYEEIIKDNIAYDILLQDRSLDRGRLNEIVDLMQTIAEVLKKIEDYSISNRAEFEALVKKNLAMQQTDQTKKQQKRIPQITTRLEQIDKVLNKLYEDNALGTISQDRYEQMSQKYSEEYYALKAELATLQEQLSAYENAGGRAQKFLKLTERHAAFTDLTPAILNEFISRIEVHERDQKRARYAIQHISIYFNYIGKFENEVTQLAEPTEQEIRQMREEIEEAKKEKSRAYHRQYSREYRARNLEKQREYDRMKAREYRARRKAQAAAAQPTQ